MKKTLFIALFFACLFPFVLNGQTYVSVPYSFGFEDDESQELANWEINPGTKANECNDKWVVGSASKTEGEKGLYISADDGVNCNFGAKSNVQYAYRDFVLPPGYYVVSFDWRSMGCNNAGLYAGIYYTSSLNNLSNVPMEASPNKTSIDNALLNWSEIKNANHVSHWENRIFENLGSSSTYIYSNGSKALRLYFIWVNANKDTTLSTFGACIDNIAINSAECATPTNLTATMIACDTIQVAWEGLCEKYELEYRRLGDKNWNTRRNVTEETYTFTELIEGQYDFRVRGVCNDTIVSAYSYLNNFVIFCPENRCINFVDLYAPTTTCYTGLYRGDSIIESEVYANKGVVDFGSEEKASRHTVNWDQTAFDPRTGNQLPLIPDGEYASVRLGNWNIYSETDAIAYTYHVESDEAAILLLKYAAVLGNPWHETESTKPRFRIEILDERGRSIDPTCGTIDFIGGEKMEGNGWHSAPSDKQGSADYDVCFKEWTTVGLNLTDYAGQDIMIRLTTTDCALGAHYGYAYFTLNCASAKIYSSSCGDEPTVSINAPTGFLYQWYDSKGNPVPDSRGGRSLSLQLESSDTTTYTCRLTSTENPDCYFELSTANIPRYPYAEFSYEYTPSDCKNLVKFTNTSHIVTGQGSSAEHQYNEECEMYEWSFSNGEVSYEKNPTAEFDQAGGNVSATLYAYIAEKACVHDTTIYFTLPAIGDTDTKIDTTICDGTIMQIGDEHSDRMFMAGKEGEYHVAWKSVAGCDSAYTYNLHISTVDSVYMPKDTVICYDQQLVLNGQTYRSNQSGLFIRRLSNRYGCDSIVVTNVNVLEQILPKVSMLDIEGDSQYSGEIHVSGTGFDYYTMNGLRQTTNDITGLNGGEFKLMFYNSAGCTEDTTLYMSEPCRNMIFQRWNDVLSVYNSAAEQRLHPDAPIVTYSAFQWIKDDNDIIGATQSYYYEAGGLDMNSVYQVRAITSEGDIVYSCPFTPQTYSVQETPAAKKVLQDQQLLIIVKGVIFNAQGEKINQNCL